MRFDAASKAPETTYELGEQNGQPTISCMICGRKSFHPMDIKELYCGNCHAFHADLLMACKTGPSNPKSKQ